MNASRLLPVLFLVAGGLAAALFFLLPGAADDEATALAPLAPGEALEPGASAALAGGADAPALAVPEAGPDAVGGRRADARRAPTGETRGLRVRVLAPAAAPYDPELAVVAVRADLDLDEEERRDLFRELRDDPRGSADAARAEVEADGSTRLALPVGRGAGEGPADDRFELFVDGRFLFLPEPVEVTPDAGAADLEARLGACLVVELEDAPRGVAGELTLTGGSFGGRGRGWQRFDRGLDDELEFRGLDPELTWMVVPSLAEHHPDAQMGLELEPGELRTLALRPTDGATVRGTVVDDAGEPVPDVEVATLAAMPWMGGLGQRETTTDAAGGFVLRGVAPGEQELEAELEGWRSARSDVLELVDGQELSGVVLNVSRGETIAGRVRWPDGRPAVGADVSVESRRRRGGWGGWGGSRSTRTGTETDADGAFRVTGLAEGAYTVRASLARAVGDGAPADAGDTEDAPTWRADEPGVDAGATDLVLELSGPEAFSGRVVDDRGEPVTSFRIEVEAVEDGGPEESQSYEDDEGRFTFARVGAGDWTVDAEAEGHVLPEEAAVALPWDGAELELVLERTASVAGRVVDVGGAPVPGATVVADDGSSAGNPWRGPRGPRVETDGEGRFELDEVTPGSLALTASADGWADSEDVALTLAPGTELGDVALVLRVGGRIEGAVLTPEGDPVADQRVAWGSNAMGFGSRGETRTDSAGRFAFDHVTPGDWAVTAAPSMAEMSERMRGRRDQSAWTEVMGQLVTETVTVVDGETVEVFLGGEPRQPVRVAGVVTMAGDPVADAAVVAVSEGSAVFQGMKSVQSGEDGSFELVVDRPGPHVLSARSGSRAVEAVIEIPRVEELRVDLAIPLGRIEGVVRKPGGRPAPGVRVAVQREDGMGRMAWGSGQAVTDDSGSYSIEALPAGTYTVRANAAGWGGRTTPEWGSVSRGDVEVEADTTVGNVDFRLERAGVVEGVVVGPGGEPVDGASLFFRDATGRMVNQVSSTRTNAAGEFRREGLAPGEYSVSARSQGYASPGDLRVAVRADETAEARVELRLATTLVVRLEEEDGDLRRARFQVFDSDGVEVGGAMTMEDMRQAFNEGSADLSRRIGPLAAGRYTVRATTADGETTERRVTLREREGEKTVRLKLD